MVAVREAPPGREDLGMAAWRWRAQRLARRMWRRSGWSGAALAGVALACLLVAWWAQVQRGELSDLRRAASVRATGLVQPTAPRQIVPTPTTETRERLRRFLADMPAHDDVPAVLQDMLALAEREGLVLAKGEYQFQIDQAGGFARYHMALPVRGKGAVVRRFVGETLRVHPYLALESVQFRRERADAVEVEARIRWMLLTKLPAGGAS